MEKYQQKHISEVINQLTNVDFYDAEGKTLDAILDDCAQRLLDAKSKGNQIKILQETHPVMR